MARTCILRAFGLQTPWRFLSGVTFVLFCFVFHLYAFVEAAALRSIVLRYAGVPIAIRVSFFLLLVWRCRFFRVSILYHFRFLSVWRERRTFFPSGWCFFYLVTTGWIFDISLLCEFSVNSIKIQCKDINWLGNGWVLSCYRYRSSVIASNTHDFRHICFQK